MSNCVFLSQCSVFFPKVYKRYCHLLNAVRPFVLQGKVEETFNAVTVTVRSLGFLEMGGNKTRPPC